MYPEYRKKIAASHERQDRAAKDAEPMYRRRAVMFALSRRFGLISPSALGSLARSSSQNFDAVEINVQPAQGNVYMLVGAGGNVTVQIGKDGVLVVDTQYAPLSTRFSRPSARSRTARSATSSTRTSTAITPAATRTSARPAARSPAATSRATSRTPPRARRSSRTTTCSSG